MARSACIDCGWKNSCQKLERLNCDNDERNNPGHTNGMFGIIILICSAKNCDRSYKTGGEKGGEKEDKMERCIL
jgi:hypothetical protein